MGLFDGLFVDVKHGSKITYSESDLRKWDRTYEKEILADDRRRVMSPLRKVPQQAYLTQIRDYAFERILDGHMYTFQHILVVPNPYDIVKQSALLLFNSSKETKIRYRVLGDTEDGDFRGETEYTKRHRVPIFGLYFQRSNKVELEMVDRQGKVVKRRMIRIFVSEKPKKLLNILGKNTKDGEVQFPFVMVNGVSFNPMAVDCNGDIRYSIQLRTNSIGMIPLAGGRFLYEDRTANRMNKKGQIKPCRYHEMDYLGRVYRTFLLESPIEGYATQGEDSLFLVTSADENHRSDQIMEMDMSTGEIVKRCNLTDLIGDKYRNCENWAQITSIFWRRGNLVLSMKKVHTVLEIDWGNLEISWALAPESVWKGSRVEPYLLKGDRPAEEICAQPDYVTSAYLDEEAGKERVLLFQERNQGKVPLSVPDGERSGLAFVDIYAREGRFQMVDAFDCVKTREHGISLYDTSRDHMFLSAGGMKQLVDGNRCKLEEMDFRTGKEIHSLYIRKGVNRVWEFAPDVIRCAEPVEMTKDVIFGQVSPPEEFHGELPELAKGRLDRNDFSGVCLCEDLFISSILPGKVSRLYFVGKHHAYVQDYSNMVTGKVKFPFVVSLREFAVDEYQIYVESQGKVYRLKNEIRVTEQ